MASLYGHVNLARFLHIEHGVLSDGHVDLIRFHFMEHSAQDKYRQTPLHRASFNGQVDLA